MSHLSKIFSTFFLIILYSLYFCYVSSLPTTNDDSDDDYYSDLYSDTGAFENDSEVLHESQVEDENQLLKNIDINKNNQNEEGLESNDYELVEDHSAHGGHGGGHGGHSMAMSFSTNLGIDYLWPSLKITNNTELFWYCLLTFAAGLLVEYIKSYRVAQLCTKNSDPYDVKLSNHYQQTFLHFIQTTLAYLLMLVAMTFNYFLFAAVMLGLTVGYGLFKAPAKYEEPCECGPDGVGEEQIAIKKHVEELTGCCE